MKCNNCIKKISCTKNYDFLMDLNNDCEEGIEMKQKLKQKKGHKGFKKPPKGV